MLFDLSIVFSQSDYDRIIGTELPQFVQQSAGLTFTLVVVGCSGSGPSDDNVGELLKWLHKGFSGLGDQHFALTTDDNIDTWPPGVTVVRGGARERYETALRLYHEAGEVLGEANALIASATSRFGAPIMRARTNATRRRCRSTASRRRVGRGQLHQRPR